MDRPLSNKVVPALGCALVIVASAAAAQPRPTVAIDVSALSDSAAKRVDALALETRVVQRLLQEGFAVVAPFTEPDVLLALEGNGERIRLVASGGGDPNAVDVSLATGSLAELQLELSQRLVDLARAQIATLPSPSPEPEAEAEAERPAITPLRPRPADPALTEGPAADDAVHFDVGIGADALWRIDGIDPLARVVVSTDVAPEGRWSVRLAAGFARSSAPGLEIFDWQLQAGVGLRLWRIGRLSARASLLLGVAYHDWVTEPSGGIADITEVRPLAALASVDYEVLWRVVGPLQLGIRIAPGISLVPLTHTVKGTAVWGRNAARVESGLFLAAGF